MTSKTLLYSAIAIAVLAGGFFYFKRKQADPLAKAQKKYRASLPDDKALLVKMYIESHGFDNTQERTDSVSKWSIDDLKDSIAKAYHPPGGASSLNFVAGEPVHCSMQIPNAGNTCQSYNNGNTFVWKRLSNGNIELTSFNILTGQPLGNPAIIQTHFRNFSGLRIT